MFTRDPRRDACKHKKAKEDLKHLQDRRTWTSLRVPLQRREGQGTHHAACEPAPTDLAPCTFQEQLITREHRKEARKRKMAEEASEAPSGREASGGGAANGSADKDVAVENADELPPQVQRSPPVLLTACTLLAMHTECLSPFQSEAELTQQKFSP